MLFKGHINELLRAEAVNIPNQISYVRLLFRDEIVKIYLMDTRKILEYADTPVIGWYFTIVDSEKAIDFIVTELVHKNCLTDIVVKDVLYVHHPHYKITLLNQYGEDVANLTPGAILSNHIDLLNLPVQNIIASIIEVNE